MLLVLKECLYPSSHSVWCQRHAKGKIMQAGRDVEMTLRREVKIGLSIREPAHLPRCESWGHVCRRKNTWTEAQTALTDLFHVCPSVFISHSRCLYLCPSPVFLFLSLLSMLLPLCDTVLNGSLLTCFSCLCVSWSIILLLSFKPICFLSAAFFTQSATNVEKLLVFIEWIYKSSF